MDRREFIKASGVAVAAIVIPAKYLKGKTPVDNEPEITDGMKIRYRGFDVRIDMVRKPYYGLCKQAYATNGSHHNSILFKEDLSDNEVWRRFRPALDGSIDRFKKRV